MSSLRLALMANDGYPLTWPQTVMTTPFMLISAWTFILMFTFFAQITAVVILSNPSLNIRELLWSNRVNDEDRFSFRRR